VLESLANIEEMRPRQRRCRRAGPVVRQRSLQRRPHPAVRDDQLNAYEMLLYKHRNGGILGFSEAINRPLLLL
jgi:hypothetical protein